MWHTKTIGKETLVALADAQKWLDPAAGEPADGYITPSDIKAALAQTYSDFPPSGAIIAPDDPGTPNDQPLGVTGYSRGALWVRTDTP